MNRFPQALYIAGGAETIEGRQFTSKLVHDADQLEAARADGWHSSTDEAAAAEDEQDAAKADAQRQAAEAAVAASASLVTAEGGAAPAKLAEPGANEGTNGDDNAPPTRAELEQKATELGVKFSPQLGDAKLAERIAAKLAEPGT